MKEARDAICQVLLGEVEPGLDIGKEIEQILLHRPADTASDPVIQVGRVSETGDKGLLLSVFMLQEGEERIVAERLHAILKKAAT